MEHKKFAIMKSDRKRQLPNRTSTEDVEEYLEAWTTLGKEVCVALGRGEPFGFDPDIQIHFLDSPHETLTLPVWVAKRIVALYKRPTLGPLMTIEELYEKKETKET